MEVTLEDECNPISRTENEDTDEHLLAIDDTVEEPRLLIEGQDKDDTADVHDEEFPRNENDTQDKNNVNISIYDQVNREGLVIIQ